MYTARSLQLLDRPGKQERKRRGRKTSLIYT